VFDEIEMVHGRVEGTGVGRRVLTQQVNYAYATLIAAHFQRFARALHTEASQIVAATASEPTMIPVLERLLTQNRALDRGNPTPGNLGSDFRKFGIKFWDAVEAADSRNAGRKKKLGELCEWRNGIAHGDIARKKTAGTLVPANLTLDSCRDWRRALGVLATSIDRVVGDRCQKLGGGKPW
jgi:hypothetical protein